MIESKLSLTLVRSISDVHFKSKRAMVSALNIPYRTLLSVCSGSGSKKSVRTITHSILRYCVKHQICIDPTFMMQASTIR